MIVKLLPDTRVSVVDVDNLRELKVVAADGMDAIAAEAGLVGLGRVSDQHAWLDVVALRDAARPHAKTADWEREFRAMILYATAMGWTDSAATSVRAHIEFQNARADRQEQPGVPRPHTR